MNEHLVNLIEVKTLGTLEAFAFLGLVALVLLAAQFFLYEMFK